MLLSLNRALTGVVIGFLVVVTNSLYADMPLPLDPNYTIPGVKNVSSTVYTIPSVAKPAYGIPFVDLTFGTRVTRIAGDPGAGVSWPAADNHPAGSTTWSNSSDGARHHYQKDQPWNSDQSLIVMQNSGNSAPYNALMLDGNTYKVKYCNCSGYSLGDDRWHPLLPNIRINVKNNLLQWYDVVNCTLVRQWTLPWNAAGFGSGEGNPSFDGRYICLADNSTKTKMRVVDMNSYPTLRITASDVMINDCGLSNCSPDWVSVSPSGKYVVVSYNGDHLRVYDLNPDTLAITPRPMPTGTPECATGETPSAGYIYDLGHADMTLNPFDNNEDVIVGQHRSWCGNNSNGDGLLTFSPGSVVMVRLRDNAVFRVTIPGNEASAHHISTRAYNRPGWAYVGYYTTSGKHFSQEVVAVKLDGSGQVERYAHHHSDETLYRDEIHAVPSPDGRRVIFASDWMLNCPSGSCGAQANPQDYVMETTPVGDLTHGGSVDFEDLEWFALNWLDSGCGVPDWCGGSDLNRSGTVDLADFSTFAANWLKNSI